jgi:hypothetical protein
MAACFAIVADEMNKQQIKEIELNAKKGKRP